LFLVSFSFLIEHTANSNMTGPKDSSTSSGQEILHNSSAAAEADSEGGARVMPANASAVGSDPVVGNGVNPSSVDKTVTTLPVSKPIVLKIPWHEESYKMALVTQVVFDKTHLEKWGTGGKAWEATTKRLFVTEPFSHYPMVKGVTVQSQFARLIDKARAQRDATDYKSGHTAPPTALDSLLYTAIEEIDAKVESDSQAKIEGQKLQEQLLVHEKRLLPGPQTPTPTGTRGSSSSSSGSSSSPRSAGSATKLDAFEIGILDVLQKASAAPTPIADEHSRTLEQEKFELEKRKFEAELEERRAERELQKRRMDLEYEERIAMKRQQDVLMQSLINLVQKKSKED
jgi:hypothetical protein